MAEGDLKSKVLKSLEKIRPALQSDGGDIELVEVDEKEKSVMVRFQGACMGCMGAASTLEYGIKETICKQVPEVKEVRAI